jgi:hypothetical protein
MEKWKFLSSSGLEFRPLGRPVRSQSLYRLSYPVSELKSKKEKISANQGYLNLNISLKNIGLQTALAAEARDSVHCLFIYVLTKQSKGQWWW